jgi:two-component system cell cycle sensor histidine kinase PleC
MKCRTRKSDGKSALSEYSRNLGNAIARHQAKLAERAARVEAEQASRMKSTFIANMSHELRTPLNAIMGFSDILGRVGREPIPPAQVAEYAGYIHDAAEHLLAVVNSILSISKIESGTTVLDIQDVDLEEVLRSAMKLLEMKAAQNGIVMHQTYDADLPIIKGDPVRLKQVYVNLIGNAVKFTPAGGLVSAAAHRFGEHSVLVTIGDTGIGMSPADIQVALSPFGQVDNELSRKQEGTGLGLAIAKGLVEQHGGVLEVSSEKGQGTVIATVLPIGAAAGQRDVGRVAA